MQQPLGVARPQLPSSLTTRWLSLLSRYRMALTGAVVVGACAAACAFPLLVAAGLGAGATAVSRLGPAGGVLVGLAVVGIGLGLRVVTRRARQSG